MVWDTYSAPTRSLSVSRALARLVTGLDLVDGWDVTQGQTIYTHYRAQGASQIDSIYLFRQLLKTKQGEETVAAAFTDHLAAIASSLFVPCTTQGKDYWPLNPTYMDDKHFLQTFSPQPANGENMVSS